MNVLTLGVLENRPMASNSSRQHPTAVLLDEQDLLQSPTCPLCHTSATLAPSPVEASGDWRCVRCGQQWDAARLAAVAAYTAWAIDHGRADGGETALCRDSPSERLGGRPLHSPQDTSNRQR
jgi:ribosomal protein L37AE/L43A